MNTVLFDLDGTLLPVNMQDFIDTYILLLENRLISVGYNNADHIVQALWSGIRAVRSNDGLRTNEECFWKVFMEHFTEAGKKSDRKLQRKLQRELHRFYNEDFQIIRYLVKPLDIISDVVGLLRKKGYQLAIATNPIFPENAILQRISWCGLQPDDFSLITTYENSCYAKPDLNYYKHLLHTLDKDPVDCLMVGNDVHEDMCAAKLGVDVFLLDEYLLNKYNEDTGNFKKGDWTIFKKYVTDLPDLT